MVVSGMKLRRMRSKGQSLVISSVLLILLVVVVTFIIIGFVVPFVKNQLSGTDCFDAVGDVEIVNSNKYTCYAEVEMLVRVRVNDDENIKGFTIVLGGATTKSYEIKGGDVSGVVMYDDSASLVLPGKNEERTYKITTGIPENINLYPILKDGRSCESAQEVNKIISCE